MAASDFFSALFPQVIFKVNTAEKNLFLTFDDGPTEVTPWVLQELNKYSAKATFFCVGANVEANTGLYQELIHNRHAIGNHTMHHLNGWRTKAETYIGDVNTCERLLSDVGHQTSDRLFRPPYGKISLSQYFSLKKNYRIVMWDVLSKDYAPDISAEKCLQRVITKSKPGSVVVFHDSRKAEKNLRFVLPRVLEYFSEKNFAFRSLAD